MLDDRPSRRGVHARARLGRDEAVERRPRGQLSIIDTAVLPSTTTTVGDMRFGIFTGMGNTTWDAVLELWRHAATSGWDAACVTDHFMPNTPDRVGDTMECWTTLAALAA